LRAGLATIKAFSATLGRPVVGVSTLHAIARAARPAHRLWAMIPAGRGEVFAQLLSVSRAGEVEELADPIHVNPSALIERQQNSPVSVKWAGGGAHAAAARIAACARAAALDFTAEEGVENFTERDDEGPGPAAERLWTLARPVEILAEHVAALALQSYRAGLCVRAADLRAHYVRASDAELNERWRSQQSLRK
jgi:tRNA threonylcarbamoyl adenosine modification protein YeaZ